MIKEIGSILILISIVFQFPTIVHSIGSKGIASCDSQY